jgi:hypothetical protein
MRAEIQFATLFFACKVLACELVFCSLLVAGQPALQAGAAPLSKQADSSQMTVDARDLPADQYARLKTLALSGSRALPSLRMRNPQTSKDGLDLAVNAALDAQREYLSRSQSAEKRPSQSMLRREASKSWGIFSGAAVSPLACLTPTITSVNGRAVSAIFTPRVPDNHFRIEGCGFGAKPGDVRLEAEGQVTSLDSSTQNIGLQIENAEAWTDDQIDVQLDPRISGIPDSSVVLVIQLADGRRAELSGCRFIAIRGEPTMLKRISTSWVKLSATTTSYASIRQLEYVSPSSYGEGIPGKAASASAVIVRSDADPFAAGSHGFDLAMLNPGWVVESVAIQNYVATCPGDVTHATQSGDWNTSFSAHGFTVAWASNTCVSFIPPTFRFSMSSSQYAIKVWVTGPIGTEPLRSAYVQPRSETLFNQN